MANNDKNLDKALNNAIDDLLKDYREAMATAINFAVDQAKKDIMKKAKTCLLEYYNSREPEQYDRTYILQHAFIPYSPALKTTNKNGVEKVSGSVGVEYSPTELEKWIGDPVMYMGRDGTQKIKHVGYYGSSNYQPVDAEWVIDNYLLGIHPTTDADDEYIPVMDSKSPNAKMNEFIKNYEKTFDENVLLGMMAQIARKI